MSLRGPRRRIATCLLLAGLTGLCGCDALTDAPLTDSEMSAFLAEADSRATRSRGQAFQVTVVAAADQRSTIAAALSLSRGRSEAAAEAATLATRVGAIAGDLSEAESTGLESKRTALDQAIEGEDVEAITTALTDLRDAVAAAESAVSARRSSAGQDQAAPSTQESQLGAPGRAETGEPAGDGESAEADREADQPGEGESESPAQVGAPPGTEPSGPQDSAEPAQAPPPSQGEHSQEP
ncbi:hypothetical protein [Actinomyces oris]|uniref:hypothetical protein n=1 Tax=Actinomyces oris TaxID=544580 RepID=UPI00094BEF77|nr:hypothetical protein [Actinomyces oris]OLO65380.1 hypothetical protein BKH22_03000 [Actinomyces oris]